MATELYPLYGLEHKFDDQRRVPHEEKRTPEIKQLWSRHHRIVNLAAEGFKQNDIAEILNITPQVVSNTLNSVLGEEKLSKVLKDRDEETKLHLARVEELKVKALKVYHEVFDGQDEYGNVIPATIKERLHAADVVTLEFAGMKSATKIQTSGVVLTGSEILEFRKRGLDAAKSAGYIIDVECEEESKE
jgi:hypothetical protein